MLKELKRMFGFAPQAERPNPDPISAQVVVATQRNERAGERLREVLLNDKQSQMGAAISDIVGKMR